MAKLNAQFFETISTVCSLIDVLIYMNNMSLSAHWVVTYESWKTKEKSSQVIPKWSRSLQELSVTKSQFKQWFTKVVVTRANRLWKWSQGELWLYLGIRQGGPIDIVATGREMVKENKICSVSGKILVISLGLRENLSPWKSEIIRVHFYILRTWIV